MTSLPTAGAVVHAGWRELDEVEWLQLPAPAHPFESRPWLVATQPDPMSLVTMRDPEAGLLALPLVPPHAVSHLDHPRAVFAGHQALKLLRRVDQTRALRLPPERAWSGVYSVTAPHSYRCCWRGRGASRAALRALLTAALRTVTDHGGHGIALPYLRAEDGPLVEAALDLGGQAAVLGAGCRLPIRWTDLDEYFRWLGPGRRSVRKAYRRPGPGSRHSLLVPASQPLPERLRAVAVALLTVSAGQHGEDPPPVPLYRAVAGAWPAERLVVWTEEHDTGAICALGMILPHEGELVCKWFGDPLHSGEYFQLGYPLVVDFAIRHGMHTVDWGGSGHGAKLLRGGDLYWICGAVVTVDRAFRAGLTRWFDEYGRLVVDYLAALTQRFGYSRQSPPVPSWASPVATAGAGGW